MLLPKRTKFRKYQKGTIQGIKSNTTCLHFGRYAIKTLETGRISARTLEAVRRVITRRFKRMGKVWIRVFPDIVVTSKPAEARMGKGKGSPTYWICRVQKGQLLFEMDGVPLTLAQQASVLAYYKLPVKTKFIIRD